MQSLVGKCELNFDLAEKKPDAAKHQMSESEYNRQENEEKEIA